MYIATSTHNRQTSVGTQYAAHESSVLLLQVRVANRPSNST